MMEETASKKEEEAISKKEYVLLKLEEWYDRANEKWNLDYLLSGTPFLPWVVFIVFSAAAVVLAAIIGISLWFALIPMLYFYVRLNMSLYSYELWRASGSRGIYMNPGPTHSIEVLIRWRFFGWVFWIANMIRRRSLRTD